MPDDRDARRLAAVMVTDIAGISADLGEESTNLGAQQIKQQLSVKALAIADARPAIILSLFR